ncbi:2045_t:CDS:2, partial [Acaulospora morrowiae]
MTSKNNEERIVLNVGGIKYETLRSTLTAYPETLLGTMFSERNQEMLHPVNGNEYFIDRNGRAFHYIMEFYRTGKHTWDPDIGHQHLKSESNSIECLVVTKKELDEELDYFQIPIPNILQLREFYIDLAKDIGKIVTVTSDLIYEAIKRLESQIIIIFSPFTVKFGKKGPPEVLSPLPRVQKIFEIFGEEINEQLQATYPMLTYQFNHSS